VLVAIIYPQMKAASMQAKAFFDMLDRQFAAKNQKESR